MLYFKQCIATSTSNYAKFETFVAVRNDFIKYFTYLLQFYFSEKANVTRTVQRKN